MQDRPGPEDIVFKCPHCGKSLAIDRRGAGLEIRCPECHKPLTVPEPDYEEIPPEQLRIRELEDALHDARRQVAQLTEELNHVTLRRNHLEKLRARSLKCFERIDRDLAVMTQAIQRIRAALLDAGFSPVPSDSTLPDAGSSPDAPPE